MCNSNATMSLPLISIHIHCMYTYIYVCIYWVLSVTLIRSGVNVRKLHLKLCKHKGVKVCMCFLSMCYRKPPRTRLFSITSTKLLFPLRKGQNMNMSAILTPCLDCTSMHVQILTSSA